MVVTLNISTYTNIYYYKYNNTTVVTQCNINFCR